ncbi:bifunctional diaminohydroxyphosphoribosylaminopyrimidine deaminase/5-amino-6-(5-phosphoribosylamino)uracil reductase RibD [Leptotrichia sp. oral taxon 847]|uniref:bifunctional diaminohydroxyphosphoribosylaminopyrimidine deaminase/5-amino-6-(5-phosphoribosylamino)uracil reductase RibD n=1 Tax=Leptotrichia sp. oral taxon 847 TaxID=1785996 RepID=UPI000A759EDC|nr:bifunctional diaminohydroxyphosphoribosylaminopyrimidine deaminase/5-amino-6-(5-phosphoribosylamino)uracil reductase RibD [Leptotrichia sp. oral taxon 847]
MEENIDKKYMRMAIELARKGEGTVNPNPLVGAVVVKDGKVVGKGYHRFFGGPHAEVYALEEAGKEACGATIYVTLEPCSHYGKTPPCAKKIIDMGVKKCFVGSSDPNPQVAGKGVAMLKKAGIEVVENVLKDECDKLNQVFFKYIKTKIPYLFLKCAITLDGKIATKTGNSKWITNELAREKVQFYRNKFMGIMVGINTVILDNPSLTSRISNGVNPFRIVVDPHLKIDENCRVVKNNEDEKTVIITSQKNQFVENSENINDKDFEIKMKQKRLSQNNKVKFIFLDKEKFSFKKMLEEIGKMGIDSVLLEGGESLISLAFKEEVIDAGEIFVANKILGDKNAKPFISGFSKDKMEEAILLNNVKNNIYGENVGMEFYLKKYSEK